MSLAAIFGVAGPSLTSDEAAFFARARPWGFILFARNVESPDQVKRLTGDLRRSIGWPDAPVLVDQEGGRVQRLRPPHWRRHPPAAAYGGAGADLARLGARLIAEDLRGVGITVDCAPVADVPGPGAHEVIGDRAFAAEAGAVADLARAVAEGLLAGGVLPIVKHIPGHGRARADSHEALPKVEASRADLAATDFAAFRALADLPAAMTAHVVYAAVDADRPATISPKVITEVIRGEIGFDGLLISDDLSMKALAGSLAERAGLALSAGCDLVLHCNGVLDEMEAVASAARPLEGRAAERAAAALACIRTPAPFDAEAGAVRWESAMAMAR